MKIKINWINIIIFRLSFNLINIGRNLQSFDQGWICKFGSQSRIKIIHSFVSELFHRCLIVHGILFGIEVEAGPPAKFLIIIIKDLNRLCKLILLSQLKLFISILLLILEKFIDLFLRHLFFIGVYPYLYLLFKGWW